MSLNVEYVFKVLDRFSGPLDRMAGKVNGFNDRIEQSNKNIKKLGEGMAKAGAIMSAAVTLPLAMMGKHFINAASDAEETRSKYATVFKDIGAMAQNTADEFADSFGLAGTTARKLLGDTGDMLSGFGFTSEAALKLSKRTNELAVDLASFTNFSGGAEGASAALTKALLGERESVKSLGIAILEEDVKKKVALMRSQGMRFASMREAKAYATLEIAIEQSKNAIGDYARTKASFANVQRRVTENNKEMSEAFGKILIPVATKALNVIDKMQTAFINMSDGQKKIIIAIAAFVGVIGPLLLLLGGIALMIPVITAGFAALGVIFTPVGAAIAAITVAIGFLIMEFAKLSDMAGGVWEGIKVAGIGVANVIIEAFDRLAMLLLDVFVSPIKSIATIIDMIPGIKLPEELTNPIAFSQMASDRAARRDEQASQYIAGNAAKNNMGKATVSGQASVDVNVKQGDKTEKQTVPMNLGGQMAGAY